MYASIPIAHGFVRSVASKRDQHHKRLASSSIQTTYYSLALGSLPVFLCIFAGLIDSY